MYGKEKDGRQIFAGALGTAHTLVSANRELKDREVYQPSPMDFGEPDFDAIGSVPCEPVIEPFEHWLRAQKRTEQEILEHIIEADAAYAKLYPGRMVVLHQFGTGATITSYRDVELGSVLTKSGRGSGVTRGYVDGIGYYRVNPTSGDLHWLEGFRLSSIDEKYPETLSSPGDSGSLWYGQELDGVAYGVGLHVDGEKTDDEVEYAVACHLPYVLSKLKVGLTPEAIPDGDAQKHEIYDPGSDWSPPTWADEQGIKEVKMAEEGASEENSERRAVAEKKAATKAKAARSLKQSG